MILLLAILVLFNVSQGFSICKRSDKFCYCDEKCFSYGDCCPEHQNRYATGPQKHVLTCKRFSRYLKMWIVDRCPDKDHALSNLCRRVETLPNNRLKSMVHVVTDDDELYENAFCALCNGKTTFQYINTSVECGSFVERPKSRHEINQLLKGPNRCTFKPKFLKTFRLCDYTFVGTCPLEYSSKIENKITSEHCEKKVSELNDYKTDGKAIFRNADCCTCWPYRCLGDFRMTESYSLGFSYLLNFNEWEEERVSSTNLTTVSYNGSQSSRTIGDYLIHYTSFIFTLFSVVALTIFIIIYSSHSIFHNFGGYLTICLSACLLLLHLLTLLLTNETLSSSSFCRLFGILQHYVALSNFMWMAIYGLDLLQTFGLRATSRSKKKSVRRFFIYFSIGFGLVFVVVGAAVIAEFNIKTDSSIKPKYGGDKCWFTSKIGGIVWYFLPVCILLAWNLGACVTVFYKLSKTAKECRVVQQKESNKTMWLCVRLTAVFGIGYLVQIIAVLSGVNVLIVAGSLLNCLQGCFLVICFLWPKRVRSVVSSSFSTMVASKGNSSNTAFDKQSTKCTHVSKDLENLNSVKSKDEL